MIRTFIALALLAATPALATLQHQWSQSFGSPGSDTGWTVAHDDAGNVLVTGVFSGSIDFGGGPLVSAGGWDVFVARFDPDGNLLWSRRAGGTGDDEGWGIAADDLGNVFVCGYFYDTADIGENDLVSAGGSDIFLARWDADGTFRWSRAFGGPADDAGWALAVDLTGNVTMTGSFASTIDFGGGAFASAGEADGFVAAFDAGGAHRWSRVFGDTGWDEGYSVATDSADNVFVTGYFGGSVDFGGGPLLSAGGDDLFLVRYGPDGSHHLSRGFGDADYDRGIKISVDAGDDVALVGYFAGTIDLGGGPLASAGLADVLVAKFDNDENHLWSRSFGGTDFDLAWAVATDELGRVAVAGAFWGTTNLGGGDLTSAGANDAFVAQYDAGGSHLWSQRYGDTGNDEAYGLAMSPVSTATATGYFTGTVDFGGGPLTSDGLDDVFLVRFGDPSVLGAPTPPAPSVLAQNYPNPFNPRTTIEYELTARAPVTITIHDATGSLVATLDQGLRESGVHRLQWDAVDSGGRSLPSGVYFYGIAAGGDVETRKMVLLR